MIESTHESLVVDITCNTSDEEHAGRVSAAVDALDGVEVHKVSDRTFLMHLGGKLSVEPKVELRNRDDLSRAYTPGVARVCLAIAANPADARRLTIKRNTVAVVTDESPSRTGVDFVAEHAGYASAPGDVDIFGAKLQVSPWYDGCRRAEPDRPVENVDRSQWSAGQPGLPGRPLQSRPGCR